MRRSFAIYAAAARRFVIVVGVALLLACGGCALIPLATLGTVLGIAGTVASTGPEVYQQGKLDTAFVANYVSVRRAVRRAAADLGLHIARDRKANKRGDIWDFKLQDDLKSKMEVTVQRRTGMLCRCQVNVGLFGSESTAKVVMHQIEVHLPPPATLPSGEKHE